MFVLYIALVGLGFFKEVELSFLLEGYTYEDIDQWFSILLSTLKKTNIDSTKEMLAVL